jgi:hypothetical protein
LAKIKYVIVIQNGAWLNLEPGGVKNPKSEHLRVTVDADKASRIRDSSLRRL